MYVPHPLTLCYPIGLYPSPTHLFGHVFIYIFLSYVTYEIEMDKNLMRLRRRVVVPALHIIFRFFFLLIMLSSIWFYHLLAHFLCHIHFLFFFWVLKCVANRITVSARDIFFSVVLRTKYFSFGKLHPPITAQEKVTERIHYTATPKNKIKTIMSSLSMWNVKMTNEPTILCHNAASSPRYNYASS